MRKEIEVRRQKLEVWRQEFGVRNGKWGVGRQSLVRFTILCFLIFIGHSANSQTVPKEIQIGDLTVQITESGRRQIQGDVDRLTRSQTYHQILVDRMNLYFPIIEEEFEKASVPKEIMFLCIQESALISDAVSSANAVGFWQFKDYTAREMGLKVDRFVDERQSIRASSRAAAKYLNSNNFYFDNWIYAVLAYQAGPTGAKQHVNENDFGEKRMTITPRSYWYVKKFLAHVVAFSPTLGAPHSEKIWLQELNNKKGKTLAQIAKEEKVELDEVKKYNKWLKGTRVPTDKTYSIYIPKEGDPPKRAIASSIKTNVQTPENTKTGTDNTSTTNSIEVKRYPTELAPGISNSNHHSIITLNGIKAVLAKTNDDLAVLSARGGISEKKFRKINEMTAEQEIETGKFYYIKKKKSKSKVGFHVVREGETFWDVAQKYGIKANSIAKFNHMSIIDDLKPGRVLWLSKKRPKGEKVAYHEISEESKQKNASIKDSNTSPANTSNDEIPGIKEPSKIEVPIVDTSNELRKVKIHTVAKGESLWAISEKYGVNIDDILRWNELANPDQLKIGQNILVKAPIEEASEEKIIIEHKVAPGETVYGISRKYGMTVDEVVDLNGINGFNIDVGQVLKVFQLD